MKMAVTNCFKSKITLLRNSPAPKRSCVEMAATRRRHQGGCVQTTSPGPLFHRIITHGNAFLHICVTYKTIAGFYQY
uniref:Uncharacterized protein n=1 Tax=Romanomermis culicivorax TaxID=13658 RepID=A0A915L8B4_ROMCU